MGKPIDLKKLSGQALVDQLIILVQKEAEDRNFPADVILGHKDFPVARELLRRLEYCQKLRKKLFKTARWEDVFPPPTIAEVLLEGLEEDSDETPDSEKREQTEQMFKGMYP